MDVILHIGAHRTATTTFQHYLRAQSDWLDRADVGFWGPGRTRSGLFHGLHAAGYGAGGSPTDGSQPACRRAMGRVALNLAQARDRGRAVLLVSDENMAGSVRDNLRSGRLYPGIGARLSRLHAAFGGQVSQVVLTIRSQDLYWTSALAFGVTRGCRVPRTEDLDRIVTAARSWRDVIADVACAMPGARIRALPFEAMGGRPETLLSAMLGRAVPAGERRHLNRAPDLAALREIAGADGLPDGLSDGLSAGHGRWQPFDAHQAAALRETYQDDLFWLAAGADGLAEPISKTANTTHSNTTKPTNEAGQTPPPTDMTRGRSHDSQQRRMAPPR